MESIHPLPPTAGRSADEESMHTSNALVLAVANPTFAREQIMSLTTFREATGELAEIIRYVEQNQHHGASLTPLYPERALQVLPDRSQGVGTSRPWEVAIPDLRTAATSLSAVHYLQLPSSAERRRIERLLMKDQSFLYVHQPATFYYDSEITSPATFGEPLQFLWGMHLCGFPKVWKDLERGADLGAIAVIDDGPVLEHVDFQGTVSGTPPVEGVPSNAIHASAVGSIIAATRNNGVGIDGCCSARVHVYNVWNSEGFHPKSMYLALKDVAVRRLPVLNLSIWSKAAYDATIERQIQDCIANGVVVVAAMGNGGNAVDLYPAVYPNVIAVGAIDHSDLRWKDSSTGKHILLSAPGFAIDHISDHPVPVRGKGTSYSAPMVSAAAYMARRARPDWGPEEIRCLLEQSARKLPQGIREVGHGCLDVVRIAEIIKGLASGASPC